MEDASIEFVKQLLDEIETNIEGLERAKAENDPRAFNELKKQTFDLHQEIGKLIK